MNQKRKIEDEIKFKELLKSPLRLFGWVYPYFFLLILAFGIFFGHQIITISFNEVPVGVADSTTVKKEIVAKKGSVAPPVDLTVVKNSTPEMIAKGKKLFDANCQSCHGSTGMGDGPAGAVLNPKPRNFHQTEGWTNGRTIDEIYKTLQVGIINNGMAAYEYLSPADRLDIILYLRTFASFPEITDAQLNLMNTTYNLSAGTVTPNQVSVNKAVQKLEEENAALTRKVEIISAKIFSAGETQETRLLRSYSYNMKKVIKSFIAINSELKFEKYYKSVSNSPIMQGYKPSVLQLTNEQWRALYDYLKAVVI